MRRRAFTGSEPIAPRRGTHRSITFAMEVRMRSRWRLAGAGWLAAAALAGCGGGNGEGLDSNGRPVGSGDGGATPLTADFASIQSHVFTPICTVCHACGARFHADLKIHALRRVTGSGKTNTLWDHLAGSRIENDVTQSKG